jgi:hypothetical protein
MNTGEIGFAITRRRRSNRPGNSQAKGPCYRKNLESGTCVPTEGDSLLREVAWQVKLSGTATDGARLTDGCPKRDAWELYE